MAKTMLLVGRILRFKMLWDTKFSRVRYRNLRRYSIKCSSYSWLTVDFQYTANSTGLMLKSGFFLCFPEFFNDFFAALPLRHQWQWRLQQPSREKTLNIHKQIAALTNTSRSFFKQERVKQSPKVREELDFYLLRITQINWPITFN